MGNYVKHKPHARVIYIGEVEDISLFIYAVTIDVHPAFAMGPYLVSIVPPLAGQVSCFDF